MVYMEFRNYRQEAYAASLTKGGNKTSHSVTVVSTLRDRTPVPQPEQLDETEAKWGKPSNFSWGSNSRDFNEGIVPSTTWEFGDNPEDPNAPPENPDPLNALVEEWTEVDRKETKVRIDGPDGAYVDFLRIDEVKFKLPDLPDGREHFVVQKFKTADSGIKDPKKTGSGGSFADASGVVAVDSGGVIRDPGGAGSL